MCHFNHNTKINIIEFLQENQNCFNIVALYGTVGTGKSTIISESMECIKLQSHVITFQEDDFFPFDSFIKDGDSTNEEEAIIIALSEFIDSDKVLILSNMECCTTDYLRLLKRVFTHYRCSCGQGTIILEYNLAEKPVDLVIDLADKIIQVPHVKEKNFRAYLVKHFVQCIHNESLFDSIISMSKGNINNFFMILNILNHVEIITTQGNKFCYKNIAEVLPQTLLQLFDFAFGRLDQSYQKSLYITAPIQDNIYVKLLESIVENFRQYEKQLERLSERNLFIEKNKIASCSSKSIFLKSYRYTTNVARKAICCKMKENEIAEFIKKYYAYIERMYLNNSETNYLTELDRVHLALLLVKNCKNNLKTTHIPLVIFVMKYHYEHFRYFDAVQYGKMVIDAEILNFEQMNSGYPDFYIIYFKNLLAIGKYDDIIAFEEIITQNDLVYLVALAFYNKGLVYKSKQVLQELWKEDIIENQGYCYALLASIYDWIGNCKLSQRYFKKALSKCHDDLELKNQLFKKYSMFIDFRLQECQDKMQNAANYYKDKNLKQYAECLHNCGTGYIMIMQFEKARELLIKCEKVLKKICDEELYYTINSKAILLCYEKRDFETAIELLKGALKYNITVDFCYLALQNNLLNLYIQQRDWEKSKSMISFIENEFSCLYKTSHVNDPKKVRPDIQHQLRHFYFNCAVYYKLKGDKQAALGYFQNAKNCSDYSSVLEFAIQQNISDIEKELKQHKLFTVPIMHKVYRPTALEKYIYDCNIYLCEVMFWG